ncbi:MAG: AzlC family ABC transporter permease [Cyanobacteria bacterium P01_A01_bin.105]
MAFSRFSSHVAKNPRLKEFLGGARAIFPLIVGAIPFGIIFGTLAQNTDLSVWAAVGFSAVVFAGSAQFVAVGLVAAGSSIPLIILTTFVVNLRHLLYAASLVPYVRHLSPQWKVVVSFFLTDEAFAAAIGRLSDRHHSPHQHWYYLGGAITMYVNWQFCTLVGITAGRMIPNAANWGLDFAMVATFIGMVVPYVTRTPMVAAVLVSAITAAITYGLPHKLGIMVAAIAGVVAGVLTEREQRE